MTINVQLLRDTLDWIEDLRAEYFSDGDGRYDDTEPAWDFAHYVVLRAGGGIRPNGDVPLGSLPTAIRAEMIRDHPSLGLELTGVTSTVRAAMHLLGIGQAQAEGLFNCHNTISDLHREVGALIAGVGANR